MTGLAAPAARTTVEDIGVPPAEFVDIVAAALRTAPIACANCRSFGSPCLSCTRYAAIHVVAALFAEHRYWSTSCMHGGERHAHCNGKVSLHGESKDPASCKYCPAVCLCNCHAREEPPTHEQQSGFPPGTTP